MNLGKIFKIIGKAFIDISEAVGGPGDAVLEIEKTTSIVPQVGDGDPLPPSPTNDPAFPPEPTAEAAGTPVNEPPAAPEATEVDKNGLPWDHRIHASTKTKKADGTWKNKRGVDPAVLQQVTAELKGAMSAPPAPETTTPPPAGDVDPSTRITTFAALATAVIEYHIDEATILQAVQDQDLENFGMLSNRPDLVPAVAEALGL